MFKWTLFAIMAALVVVASVIASSIACRWITASDDFAVLQGLALLGVTGLVDVLFIIGTLKELRKCIDV